MKEDEIKEVILVYNGGTKPTVLAHPKNGSSFEIFLKKAIEQT
jgi:hypothetical protein